MISIEPKNYNHIINVHEDGSLEEQIDVVQEYEKYLE